MSSEKKKFSGWLVVAGCFLICFCIVTLVSNTLALFMAPICDELGIDTASFSMITLVSTLVNAFGAMALAPYFQKYSIKKIMLACGIFTAICYGALGFCTQLWQLVVVFGIGNLGLTGVSQMPISMLINRWFTDKRSTALGVALCGGGIGAAIWSPIFANIIATSGWRNCFFLGGGVVLVASLVVMIFMLKDRPQDLGQEPYTEGTKKTDGTQAAAPKKSTWIGVDKKVAFKHPAFYLLMLGIFFVGCIAAGVSTHVINFLIKDAGWEATAASTVLSVFSLGTVVSMLVGGALFDKLGLKLGCLFTSGCGAVGLLCLTMAQSHVFAYLYAILFALCLCMPKMLPVLATTATFGDKDYAPIYSLLNFAMLMGCAIGAVITGIVSGMAGYRTAWIVYIVFCVLIFVCISLAVASAKNLREQYPNPVE